MFFQSMRPVLNFRSCHVARHVLSSFFHSNRPLSRIKMHRINYQASGFVSATSLYCRNKSESVCQSGKLGKIFEHLCEVAQRFSHPSGMMNYLIRKMISEVYSSISKAILIRDSLLFCHKECIREKLHRILAK